MTRRRALRGGRLGHPARSGDSFTTSSQGRRLDEQGERDMSAAAARLAAGEGALGGEVVGDQVPGRDRRAETRVPRSARRAHLEHLAALPAEAEAHVALRLLDHVAHAGAAAAQLRAVAQVERSEGRAALDPFALRGAVDARPAPGDELLEALGTLASGEPPDRSARASFRGPPESPAHRVPRARRQRSGRAGRRERGAWSAGSRFVSQPRVGFNHSGRETMNAESRTGVWIIGARGAVATTTIVGARAAALGLAPLRGVTTEGPRGEGLSLPAASALVFGGWEVRAGSLLDAAADLAESGRIFDGRLLEPLAVDLDEI